MSESSLSVAFTGLLNIDTQNINWMLKPAPHSNAIATKYMPYSHDVRDVLEVNTRVTTQLKRQNQSFWAPNYSSLSVSSKMNWQRGQMKITLAKLSVTH